MGPSNRHGASMRSLRRAARNVAVFQWPCGTLATSRRPRCAQPYEAGHVGLGPGLVDEDEPRRIDAPLMASPAQSMALHVRAVLLARDEGLFLSVTPRRRKKRLISEVSALTPRSDKSRSHSACSVMSDFSAHKPSRKARCGSNLTRL